MRKVVWTILAMQRWDKVAEYILSDFGLTAQRQFAKKTRACIKLLSKNPFMGSIVWNTDDAPTIYRYCVINKRSKLVYFLQGDIIVIANFWDVRQSQEGLVP